MRWSKPRANHTAQLGALIELSLAYQSARDFTLPVLRTAFGEPPPPSSECVWPPPRVTEREAQSRLHWICNFLNQCKGLIQTAVREIKAAQVRFVATGFDVPSSWIIVTPLETFMGGMLGACGVTEIVKSVAAEDAALEKVLGEISVDLVLLEGKIAGSTPPAITSGEDEPKQGEGKSGTGEAEEAEGLEITEEGNGEASEGVPSTTDKMKQGEWKGESIPWLISEVFSPARWIGEQLAAFDPDQIGYFLYPQSEGLRALSQLMEGIKRAYRELQTLPPDVVTEVRKLQRIINGGEGSNGNISFYDGARYYAESDIGPTGKRGWAAVMRHINATWLDDLRHADKYS